MAQSKNSNRNRKGSCRRKYPILSERFKALHPVLLALGQFVLTGWLWDENRLFSKKTKLASGLSQHHLATLNTVIRLLELYQCSYGGFFAFGFYEGCLSRRIFVGSHKFLGQSLLLSTTVLNDNDNLPPSLAKFSPGDRKQGINKCWPYNMFMQLYCNRQPQNLA